MSFWSKLKDGFKAVVNFVVEATVAVVRTVVKTVEKAIEKTAEAVDFIYKKSMELIRFTVDKIKESANQVVIAYNKLKERIREIFNPSSKQPLSEYDKIIVNLNQTIQDLEAEILKLKQQKEKNPEAVKEEDIKSLETFLNEVKDTKNALHLKQMQELITKLSDLAQMKLNQTSVTFEDLARLQTSVKFFAAIKLENTTYEEQRLIVLMEKFLYKRISDDQLEEFDELIKQREGKSLFSIGNEYLAEMSKTQKEELDKQYEDYRKEITKIEEAINDLDIDKDLNVIDELTYNTQKQNFQNEKKEIEHKLEKNQILLNKTETILMAIEGFHFIFENEQRWDIILEKEEKYIPKKCIEICELLIKNRKGETLNQNEINEVKEFGFIIRNIIKRNGSIEIS